MVLLPKEKDVVLKADDPKYNRGLVVTLKDKGGYDLYYWYDDPKKVYPAEIKVDGTVVDKAGRIVHVGFHPELAGIIADHTYKNNPSHVRYLPQNYGVAAVSSGTKITALEAAYLTDCARTAWPYKDQIVESPPDVVADIDNPNLTAGQKEAIIHCFNQLIRVEEKGIFAQDRMGKFLLNEEGYPYIRPEVIAKEIDPFEGEDPFADSDDKKGLMGYSPFLIGAGVMFLVYMANK